MPDAAPTPAPLAVDLGTAARLAGIGRSALYELLAAGEGPPTVKLGRRRLVRVPALDEWLGDREEKVYSP